MHCVKFSKEWWKHIFKWETFFVKKNSTISFYAFQFHCIRILTNAKREKNCTHVVEKEIKVVIEYLTESKGKPLETSITANSDIPICHHYQQQKNLEEMAIESI